MSNALLVIDPSKIPHCPTPESRDMVSQMVAMGLEVAQIAFCMKLTPHEVTYHYKDELEFGLSLVNAKVGVALFQRCMLGDTNAIKFWLQCRGGWVPAEKEDAKDKEKKGRLLEDRKAFMQDILEMVARGKDKEEKAAVTQRATPGARRTQ